LEFEFETFGYSGEVLGVGFGAAGYGTVKGLL
jgi:hypothetical protein